MTANGITGMQIAAALGAFAGAYLAGSVNFSLLAARALGYGDLRKRGSGNAGATNLGRVAGKGAAAFVLALDIARGAGVVLVASALGYGPFAAFAALPLLLGNLFPAFHSFKGGKGVAASVGAVLAVSPFALLASGGIFLVAFALGRRVSVGSLAMAASYPLTLWLIGGAPSEVVAGAAIGAILVGAHRRNIVRLVAGAEPMTAFGTRDKNGEEKP